MLFSCHIWAVSINCSQPSPFLWPALHSCSWKEHQSIQSLPHQHRTADLALYLSNHEGRQEDHSTHTHTLLPASLSWQHITQLPHCVATRPCTRSCAMFWNADSANRHVEEVSSFKRQWADKEHFEENVHKILFYDSLKTLYSILKMEGKWYVYSNLYLQIQNDTIRDATSSGKCKEGKTQFWSRNKINFWGNLRHFIYSSLLTYCFILCNNSGNC